MKIAVIGAVTGFLLLSISCSKSTEPTPETPPSKVILRVGEFISGNTHDYYFVAVNFDTRSIYHVAINGFQDTNYVTGSYEYAWSAHVASEIRPMDSALLVRPSRECVGSYCIPTVVLHGPWKLTWSH